MKRANLLFLACFFCVSSLAKSGNSDPGTSIPEQIADLKAQIEALQQSVPPANVALAIDCDSSESLADAVQTPARHLTISVSGTCNEDVNVTRGNLKIEGANATISGKLAIDGQGEFDEAGLVTLSNLTLQNGVPFGLAVRERNVVANNVDVSAAQGTGILVLKGANLVCRNCSSHDNGISGVAVLKNGTLDLYDHNSFSNNPAFGLVATGSGSINLDASDAPYSLDANGNGQFGLLLSSGSALHTYGATPPSVITASNNGAPGHFGVGIWVADGASANFGNEVVTESNTGIGFAIYGGTVYLGGNLTTRNHRTNGGFAGIGITDGGILRASNGHITAENNFIGMWTSYGFANMRSADFSQNVIADIHLSLNSTLIVDAITNLDSPVPVVCVGPQTIIASGGYACPSPP